VNLVSQLLNIIILGLLERWNRGFESRSRPGCMYAFFSVMLFCVGRRFATDRSPVQGVQLKCLKGFILSKGPNFETTTDIAILLPHR